MKKSNKYDFSGWATKNNLKCADGRTIRKDAFIDNDGETVPLVWQHQHTDERNVLGHALLENREDGVYAYCSLNNTDSGQHIKELVKHGDITALSIWANHLTQKGGDVLHGVIRELSLVLAGANPGACIDYPILEHGEESTNDAVIYTGEELDDEAGVVNFIKHSDPAPKTEPKKEKDPMTPKEEDKTVKDVFDSMTEDQKQVVYYFVGLAAEEAKNGDEGGNEEMKHNVFDNSESYNGSDDESLQLTHDQISSIFKDAPEIGSLRDSVLIHATEYGIENIGLLFPDAKAVRNTPDFIKRETAWVADVYNGTSHSPFSRIKSSTADITEDTARAKGYIKGNMKKEEFFSVAKRVTNPTTVYKKQKLDRDDILDITDFDVVSWMKSEMRLMLDEEIARAILIGDGRAIDSDDKINEDCIRPIAKDADLYNVKVSVGTSGALDYNDVVEKIAFGKKNYKGSGSPTYYTTANEHLNMLWIKDTMGRRIYANDSELCAALGVVKIVEVEPMEGFTLSLDNKTKPVAGIMVNMKDYTNGADKGGEINMFDDFDLDYNQYKYLMEGRCSGALTIPYSAITYVYEPAVAQG